MGAQAGVVRCPWGEGDPLMLRYHDAEWGVPRRDDQTLYEFLVLEGAQAGLSWRTVLAKRENYRKAFAGFDLRSVASFNDADVDRLLADPGIIRNRAKIASAITNARAALDLPEGLSVFLWAFVDGQPLQNDWADLRALPATTEISDRMSKELKRRGFRFVGGTTCYSMMQACGLVNDHIVSCFRHDEVR
jgi:DNA-3-methyladenine glycosylase I